MERCFHLQKLSQEDVSGLFDKAFVRALNDRQLVCKNCDTGTDALWLCLECGYLGCSRAKQRHGEQHAKEQKHGMSIGIQLLLFNYFNTE